MNNDNQEPKTENLPVIMINDGFEDASDSDRLLQGTRAICIDGEWTKPDGTKIPTDKQFLVLGTAEGQQHWEDGQLVEERIKKPGVPFAETVDELNAKIPEDTWEPGRSGPRPPWSHVYAVYLIDPTDGAFYTHLNSTDGAKIATNDLKSQVRWKRAMLGGQKVAPIVTLGRRLVSRQYKKMGPAFIIIAWRDLSPLPSTTTAPRQLEDHTEKKAFNDPVADIGRPVNEPSTMEEILGDKIPEDDWHPPGEPASEAVANAPVTPPRKPAVQKPRMTKKGVQKIAGGRGR